jgi:hypothetical protein
VAARGARLAAGQVAHDWIPGCDHADDLESVGAFLQRLRELGWIDGRDIAIEYRWAEGRDDHYAAFAAEFVQRRVDVIVTAGTKLPCPSRKRRRQSR